MAYRFLPVSTAAALLCLTTLVSADDGSFVAEQSSSLAFPFNEDQGWFTEGTLLIWRPYLEDTDYANRLQTTILNDDALEFQVKLKNPSFQWSTGVQVGFGRYLPYQKWDISFYMNYFYNDTKSDVHADRSKNSTLLNLWDPAIRTSGSATKSSVNWRLNYFTWDLLVGREYTILPSITAHPFFGIRAAGIYQDYRSNYSDNYIAFFDVTTILKGKFSAEDQFVGAGPRFGTDLSFFMGRHWSFVGKLSGAFFWGAYHLKEQYYFSVEEIQSPPRPPLEIGIKAKDGNYDVRLEIEGSLGISWETWVKNEMVRIAPSVSFQGATWFMMNDYSNVSRRQSFAFPNAGSIVSQRRNGDLSFVGVNVNLQVDF